eukprot:TRINITY_DN17400_c0_g1_i1.p1 TRINITY_DN17400_c0_g1~~TRINITY_DN17400_c0_g1_i1.p1  ORF type:complete len:700 (-),score=112.62 TRINITY_DN17400_c0_g1_i1:131-2230(-)
MGRNRNEKGRPSRAFSVPSNEAWNRRLVELKEWVQANNGKLPVRHSKNSKEHSLAQWVCSQQQKYKAGTLNEQHMNDLRAVPGMPERIQSWEAPPERLDWRGRCADLKQWVETQGGRLPMRRAEDPTEAAFAVFLADTHQKKVRPDKLSTEDKELLMSIPGMESRMLQWDLPKRKLCAKLQIDEADGALMKQRRLAKHDTNPASGKSCFAQSSQPCVPSSSSSDSSSESEVEASRTVHDSSDNTERGVSYIAQHMLSKFSSSAVAEKAFSALQQRVGGQLPGHGVLLTEAVIHEARRYCQAYWANMSSENVRSAADQILEHCKTWEAADRKFDWLWKNAVPRAKLQGTKAVVDVEGCMISLEDLEEAERYTQRKLGLPVSVAPCRRSPLAPASQICPMCSTTCMKTKLFAEAAAVDAEGTLSLFAFSPSKAIKEAKRTYTSMYGAESEADIDKAVRVFITDWLSKLAAKHSFLVKFKDKIVHAEFAAKPLEEWQAQFQAFENQDEYVSGMAAAANSRHRTTVEDVTCTAEPDSDSQGPENAKVDAHESQQTAETEKSAEVTELPSTVDDTADEDAAKSDRVKQPSPFTPLSPTVATFSSKVASATPRHRQVGSYEPRSCLRRGKTFAVRNWTRRVNLVSEVRELAIVSFRHLDLWTVGAVISFCDLCQSMKPQRTGQVWSKENGQLPIFVCKECVECHV